MSSGGISIRRDQLEGVHLPVMVSVFFSRSGTMVIFRGSVTWRSLLVSAVNRSFSMASFALEISSRKKISLRRGLEGDRRGGGTSVLVGVEAKGMQVSDMDVAA